jgi:predicted nucleotidyltransferase
MKNYLGKVEKRRKVAEDTLKKNLKMEAMHLIQLLKNKGFKFGRVYLFGSSVKDKPLAPWSDIDLAIEGLPQTAFLKVYAYLLKNSRFPVDLKPFEELDPTIREKIVKEGEIIYEKK